MKNSAMSRPWTLFHTKSGYRKDDRRNLTGPTPDWVAFFPIYPDEHDRIQTPKRWQFANAGPRKSMTENFSLTTLRHLAKHGVQPSTCRLIGDPKLPDVVASDCISFPWLIVEHKKLGDRPRTEKCYCQAANAGTAAIMMLETLSRIVPKAKNNAHIPPVVTMTTVDRVVKIWIAYSCDPSNERYGNANYVSKSTLSPFPTCPWRTFWLTQ